MKKILTYPLFILSTIFLHLFLIKQGFPLQYVPSVVAFSLIVVLLYLEKIIPYHAEWNIDRGDLKTDLIQTLVVLPIVAIIIETFYKIINVQLGINVWPTHWPFIWQLIVGVLVSEFLFYWYHRLSHQIGFLWRFHSVHHGAERVYWANSGRFHFVDIFFQFTLYFIPIFLLGAPLEVTAMFLTLNAVTGILEHANINFRTIVLSRIFNTAELHRAHHAKELKIANNNYGKILSIWDTVFGTYLKPRSFEQSRDVGLTHNKKVPVTFIEQLKYPFKNDR